MSETEFAFIDAIRANPTDDLTRLVYADWLDERGQPAKAEYLRLVAEVQRDAARFEELSATLSRGWTAEVCPFCRVVLLRTKPERMIATILLIREVAGNGLADANSTAGLAPSIVVSRVELETARKIARQLADLGCEVLVQGVM